MLFSHLPRSTLSEYDICPPLARYVWCVIWYLRSSCCSETHYAHVKLPAFLPLSTLDVTHMRKCTRPSPLYGTASDEKLGVGLSTRLITRDPISQAFNHRISYWRRSILVVGTRLIARKLNKSSMIVITEVCFVVYIYIVLLYQQPLVCTFDQHT